MSRTGKLKTYCVAIIKFVDEYDNSKAEEVAVMDAIDLINTKRGPQLAAVYSVDDRLLEKSWRAAVKEIELTPKNLLKVYGFNQITEVKVEVHDG